MCIFGVWPMITYMYVIRPSSLGFTLQTGSRINTWSLFQRIYTLYRLRFSRINSNKLDRSSFKPPFEASSILPSLLYYTTKSKNETRACKHFYKNQNRRETRYECLFRPIKPALCVDPCSCSFYQSLGVFQEETSSSTEDK